MSSAISPENVGGCRRYANHPEIVVPAVLPSVQVPRFSSEVLKSQCRMRAGLRALELADLRLSETGGVRMAGAKLAAMADG